MKITQKIWLWIFEFKIKRVQDDKKIEFLTKQLLNELENQGYDIYTEGCGHIDIWNYYSDNDLVVGNIINEWAIPCGTYEGKFMKK
jgi:hypothetical protein